MWLGRLRTIKEEFIVQVGESQNNSFNCKYVVIHIRYYEYSSIGYLLSNKKFNCGHLLSTNSSLENMDFSSPNQWEICILENKGLYNS